ncbi:hypothetical protein KL858_05585 [Mycolicibacterium goodii]|uniref:Uncharacterized protein n=1 Tax=Mycolicibacterium goodii TaxID=134601 RepID=A0ABS6HR71_MYCGD|nr:hypothetical protein [Mycolicibacterium goodii]MBU8828922.1 hypothetical protein [Mycolicibacterium goodii]MBU8840271.1 hypothetical protein [Mycolicibacterium goodii]
MAGSRLGQTLFFVARRLQAESVGLAVASPTPIDGTVGLPTLAVGGLDDGDARRLLESAFPGRRLDTAILDRIVAEARGNPLALLGTPKDITSFHTEPVSAGIEEQYRALIADLPDDTRMVLVVAAAEPVGDPAASCRRGAPRGYRRRGRPRSMASWQFIRNGTPEGDAASPAAMIVGSSTLVRVSSVSSRPSRSVRRPLSARPA